METFYMGRCGLHDLHRGGTTEEATGVSSRKMVLAEHTEDLSLWSRCKDYEDP